MRKGWDKFFIFITVCGSLILLLWISFYVGSKLGDSWKDFIGEITGSIIDLIGTFLIINFTLYTDRNHEKLKKILRYRLKYYKFISKIKNNLNEEHDLFVYLKKYIRNTEFTNEKVGNLREDVLKKLHLCRNKILLIQMKFPSIKRYLNNLIAYHLTHMDEKLNKHNKKLVKRQALHINDNLRKEFYALTDTLSYLKESAYIIRHMKNSTENIKNIYHSINHIRDDLSKSYSRINNVDRQFIIVTNIYGNYSSYFSNSI